MATEEPKTEVDIAIDKVSAVTADGDKMLKDLIDKFGPEVMKINIDFNGETQSHIEKKLAGINTMVGLVKDRQSMSIQNAKMELARIKSEEESEVGGAVVEMLKLIAGNTDSVKRRTGDKLDDSQIDADLQKAFEESGEVILDGETETVIADDE